MTSNWDVEAKFHFILDSLTNNFKFNFDHIYNHQDKSTDYDNLPCPTQLNVFINKSIREFLDDTPVSL